MENSLENTTVETQTQEVPPTVNIEIEKNGRKFYFVLPNNTPIGEAYDAAYQFLVRLTELAKEITEKAKPVEPVIDANIEQN